MTTLAEKEREFRTRSKNKGTLVSSVRILSDITQKDIEKSYNSLSSETAQTYYSNRYGETLKRTF